MKTLRYLLITFAVMLVMSVNAQGLAEKPQVGFQSTSSMVGSGSTLPQAAQTGTWTTYDEGVGGTRANKPGIRRGLDDDDDINKPGQPFPIGEGMWVLMFCAVIFSGVIAFRRKRQQRNV